MGLFWGISDPFSPSGLELEMPSLAPVKKPNSSSSDKYNLKPVPVKRQRWALGGIWGPFWGLRDVLGGPRAALGGFGADSEENGKFGGVSGPVWGSFGDGFGGGFGVILGVPGPV